MTQPASFADHPGFDAARRCFAELADARILEIAGFQESVGAGMPVVEGMRGIAGVAHKVHGVARTLGFDRLGEAAASLELWLHAAAKGPDPRRDWPAAQARIDDFLDLLETALED